VSKNTPNRFLQTEMMLLKFLSEYEWTLGLLVKYQNARFSNLIQHDIVGVLMAHQALIKLKAADPTDTGEKLGVIKKIYQTRLSRRQIRLKKFKETFADFYHQYESRLFQDVALHYSRKLITQKFEHGVLSDKVYRRLEKCLIDAQKQLPSITVSLSLAKRDGWLESVPLFAGLPKQVIKRLASNSHYISFLPGDTIFNEGDKGDSIFVLVSGNVNVFQLDAEGQSCHVAELFEGSFIGRHALSKRAQRTATIRAKTYVTLLRLTSKDVRNLSKASSELAVRLSQADFGSNA
jgi:Na+:H+ antiporter